MTVSFLARPLAGAFLALAVAGPPALADEPAIYAPGGIALSGYDAVTYFTRNHPLRGSADNALMWRGATWYFAGPDTMESFEMNPTAYAPQYGGYCAYGISEGLAESGAPDAFIIHKGKLYILHDAKVQSEIAAHIQDIIKAAEAHWPAAIGR